MNVSNDTLPCQPQLWFSRNVEYPAYLCQLALAGVGLLLNCVTLCVFVTGKEFKGAPFVFMSALALADMCTLLLKSPESFVMAFRRMPTPQPPLLKKTKLMTYVLLVNVLSPLGNITENISVWLIVCLALERYISMKCYSLAKTRCTSRNALLVTGLGSLTATAVNSFYFFGARARMVSDAQGDYAQAVPTAFYHSDWYDALAWVRACVAQFLPLLFLVVANIRLILVLHRQTQKMQKYSSGSVGASRRWGDDSTASVPQAFATPVKRSSISARRQQAQRRLTVMLVAVICLVLFGQIPQAFSFHSLFRILSSSCRACASLDHCLLYRQYKLVANVPNVLCYSCNFLIYFALNKHFRCRAILLASCGRRLPRRLSTNINNNNNNNNFSTAGVTERRCSPADARGGSEAILAPLLHQEFEEQGQELVRRRLSSGIEFIDAEISRKDSCSVQIRFREARDVVTFH